MMGFCSLLSATYPLFTITMTDTTYNGWTNRETWAIGLYLMDTVTSWIIDDLEAWAKDDTKEAGQLFKDLVDEMIEESDLCDRYSLLLDLIDLSSVNWNELGQHALDAAFD
jgi:hypothetical protein